MPRKCSICSHKNRCRIDEELANNAEYSGLARKYRVSEDAIRRHVHQGHVSKVIKAAVNAGLAKHGKTLDDRINEIYNMSIKAGKMAIGEKVEAEEGQEIPKADLRSFGSCMMPAANMAKLLYEKDTAAKLQEEIDALREQMAKDR